MKSRRWLRIIPVALIMYTISYVDRTNISIALTPDISSMVKDLGMDKDMMGRAAGIFFFGCPGTPRASTSFPDCFGLPTAPALMRHPSLTMEESRLLLAFGLVTCGGAELPGLAVLPFGFCLLTFFSRFRVLPRALGCSLDCWQVTWKDIAHRCRTGEGFTAVAMSPNQHRANPRHHQQGDELGR